MSFALSAAVSGLAAHQSMLDVAGNNLANVNTVAFKSSSVTFSDLLSQTIKRASGPSGSLGGTNPQQKGSGVQVSNITRNMNQGNILNTGQDLDAAIDGSGYFVLSNGSQVVYTRNGSFGVDEEYNLVDPATGYKVQRLAASTDNFQSSGTNSIHIPYDAAMPANPTSEVTMNGNLRSNGEADDATALLLTGNQAFTASSVPATTTTYIDDLDQMTGGTIGAGNTATITLTGTDSDGSAIGPSVITIDGGTAAGDTTVQDLLDDITALYTGVTAGLDANGNITLTADSAGYNLASITALTYTPNGAEDLAIPTWFDMTEVGGEDSKSFNLTVYDEKGAQHVLTGTFVKGDYTGTGTTNRWDMIIRSIDGEVTKSFTGGYPGDQRIQGIEFNTDGSYSGLVSVTESTTIQVYFADEPSVAQNITFDLGTSGEFTGLTQFAGETSTATALRQDGYEAGQLSGVSIDQSGMLIGTFSNGEQQDICSLMIGVFQNPQGLEAVGNSYFIPTGNSGTPVQTTANNNGAGAITGKSLEKSNVDIAVEFVNMMQAQNGFQANSRTVRVANDVLRELTSIIR